LKSIDNNSYKEIFDNIKLEFPDIKGFSIRNLKNMKKFAEEYSDFEFV
jgi:hypothetical protein